MQHPVMTYSTAILIIIEGLFQIQRFPSSKLVLKTVKSRFAALNYYENGGSQWTIWWSDARTHMQTPSDDIQYEHAEKVLVASFPRKIA